MTDAKLTGQGLRNAIVSMLSEEGVYPNGMSRAYIVNKRPGWMVGAIDNALHVLKKRCIVRSDGPEYVLTTAPDWHNKKILDEMNAGGTKAPEPAASVSSLDQKPLLSKAAHKAEVKPVTVAATKLCSHHHCTANVPVGVEYCDECEATLSGVPIPKCPCGAALDDDGCCPEPKCPTNQHMVEKTPARICSVDGCVNPLSPGMKMCNDCIEKHDFSDPDKPKMEEPTSGVKSCPHCDYGMPLSFTKCPNKLCPSNEPTVYGTDEAVSEDGEPFLWADIGAALKELEQKLAYTPEPVEIDQLELKLDVLADFERMFDSRLKPVLKAIAGDLVRCSGGE